MDGTLLDDLPDLLTVADLAQVLRIGRNSAYRLVRSGEIPSIRIGRAYRVPKAALIDYIQRQVAHR